MTSDTILALSLGTGAMLALILIIMLRYRIRLWKGLPVALLLTVTGTLGTYIWFFVESSIFGGRSYYGAVFLVPLAFCYVARLLGIPYGDLMDLCAPAECVMLAIMKYQCLEDGCCAGKVLLSIAIDGSVIFPSQLVELINALVLMAVLMTMAFFKKTRGKLYPWYLVLYGATRFVLNFFRADTQPLLLGLPAGNLWSLLAIFLGVLWLTDRKLAIIPKSTVAPESNEE